MLARNARRQAILAVGGDGVDLIDFSRYFAALLVVLGLLGGVAVVLRKGWLPAGLGGFALPERRERRLQVTDSLILDPRRRVVIVRADATEHVLLLGPERETVLDSRPARPQPVFAPEFDGGASDGSADDASETDAAAAEAATDAAPDGRSHAGVRT